MACHNRDLRTFKSLLDFISKKEDLCSELLFKQNKAGETALDLAKRRLVEACANSGEASKLEDNEEIVRILSDKHNASEKKQETLVQVLITKEEQQKKTHVTQLDLSQNYFKKTAQKALSS